MRSLPLFGLRDQIELILDIGCPELFQHVFSRSPRSGTDLSSFRQNVSCFLVKQNLLFLPFVLSDRRTSVHLATNHWCWKQMPERKFWSLFRKKTSCGGHMPPSFARARRRPEVQNSSTAEEPHHIHSQSCGQHFSFFPSVCIASLCGLKRTTCLRQYIC